MVTQDDWNNRNVSIDKKLLENRVKRYEERCSSCGKTTRYFNKLNQHKNVGCDFCGKPLIRWDIKVKRII